MRTLHFQRVVGSGAFGAVYLCDLVADKGFRRQVAVKVLQRDHPNAQMFMARVRDEARLLGLLQDDHILKVLEIVSVDGRDAVVMEFVEGLDLSALIEAGHRPPARALAELGAAMAGALHRAHTAVHPATGAPLNVIHRDVKPANVMVTARGGVKLLDFGVARARFEARESFTGQFVLGTLNYMAPEYIVTGDVSTAADVYGLGLVLWEATIGEIFGQPRLKREQHLPRQEAQLQRIVGEYAPLVPLLRRMVSWDPAERPTAATVDQELVALADGFRGSGLRAWCGTVVPELLAKRAVGADDAGLIGRHIALADTGEGLPQDAASPGIPRPAPVAQRPAQAEQPAQVEPRAAPSRAPVRLESPASPTSPTDLGNTSSALSRPPPPAPPDEARRLRRPAVTLIPEEMGDVTAATPAPRPAPAAADSRETGTPPSKPPRAADPQEISAATPAPKPPLPRPDPQEISAATPAPKPPLPRPDPQEISAATPAPKPPLPRPAEPVAALSPPTPRPRPRARSGASTLLLVVQGLIVGGGLGVLVVLFIVALYLLRRFM